MTTQMPSCGWSIGWMLVLLWSPVVLAEEGSRPAVVAHRGLLLSAPENTLANFRACLELRLGFELDVRRSKDGHLVCVHDGTVDRTTDGQGQVTELTLKELKSLDAGSWFGPEFRGARIPTLDEVFALLAQYKSSPVLLAIDIKGDDDKIENGIVQSAVKHGVLDRLLMIGRAIDATAVRQRLQAADPHTHAACLANVPDELSAAIRDQHSDWVYVRYVPSRDEVTRAHKAGKRVFIAGTTVAGKQNENWRRAAASGVDAILTDYSTELARQLREDRK